MSPQAAWILQEEICPRLCSAIPKTVLCVGSESHDELIQDATCMAARMIDRVERQGKLGKVTASNIAYYTIQHLKSGRRANGTSSVDIMASSTQLNGSTRLHSLSEVVSESECGFEIFELHDVISNTHEDPGTVAARKIDWEFFLTRLTDREKAVVEGLLTGLNGSEIGRALGIDSSTIRYFRQRLAVKILEFMGGEILRDILVKPGWKIGLECEREQQACRADRRQN